MVKNRQIEVVGLSKINSGEVVFRDVNFTVNKSDFVSIKGPSGCGKTTLLMIVSGLALPDQGKIYLEGRLANNPQSLIPPYLRQMNLLFQDLALWPHLTGIEQLKFVWGSQPTGSFDNDLKTICNRIGLAEKLLTKYPAQLSRGEQQRLAIARTFMAKSAIILLDEPLTALDHRLRIQFINLLKMVKRSKSTTVILVSHDLMSDVLDYDLELIFKDFSFVEKRKL